MLAGMLYRVGAVDPAVFGGAAAVLVGDGRAALIRRRESPKDLLSFEP